MAYVARVLGPDGIQNCEVDWTTSPPTFTPAHRAADITLVPGFVDLHIHGAFGIDFMSASADDLLVGLAYIDVKQLTRNNIGMGIDGEK